MSEFKLVSDFQPTGDQPQAIEQLVEGLKKGYTHQTLRGATGTGKSLDGAEPLFVLHKEDGRWVPRLVPIGELVDQWVESNAGVIRKEDSLIAPLSPSNSPYHVLSFNATSGQVELKPVTAFIRHQSPTTMYCVRTACGRQALMTGDHNLWVLREGQVRLVPTTEVRQGDGIPLPRSIPGPQEELRSLDLLHHGG